MSCRLSPSGFVARRMRLAVVAILLVSVALCCPRAMAVQFLLNFEGLASDYPSFDPDGSRLQALMNTAAVYWQDIFPHESWELTVKFWYDDLDGGTLGEHTNQGTDEGKPDRVPDQDRLARLGRSGAIVVFRRNAV